MHATDAVSRAIADHQAVLSVRGVCAGYEPGQPVLHDIGARVRPGRVCAVIGPNASGKSTLLRVMLGHLVPWSGGVWIGDQPVADLSARQRARRMSYVPQRGGVSFAFTVREVVEMSRYAAGADSAAVEEALDTCDLRAIERRVFATLSAGQQQRVLVARATAQAGCARGYTGRAMLLDEPASNMDLRHAHALMQRLRDRARRGLAVVIVLHDLNLAARYADDVWLLDRGRLVAAGPWEGVLRPPLLEPVYGVALRALTPGGAAKRPVIVAEPSDTLP